MYQCMPELSSDEYIALKEDIAKRGVLVPIEYDDAGNILDGHHRMRAVAELLADGIEIHAPRIIREGLSEEQKLQHARTLNLVRRHLSREQREALWLDMRRDGMSYRAIAEADGTAHETTIMRAVSPVANATPASEAPTHITGRDGKTYPATAPRPAPVPDEDAEEPDAEPDSEPVPEKPANHRALGTGDNEWYTPAQYVDLARAVMGGIDLDPASSDIANRVVNAERFFSLDDDGLQYEWGGRVWLNPPYAQPAIWEFADKMATEWEAGHLTSAVVLTHNYTDTKWFHRLAEACSAICFTRGRIRFEAPDGSVAAPTQGQAFFYFGSDVAQFSEAFSSIGIVVIPS